MKKIITLLAIAVVSFTFASCRQDDESAEFANNNNNAEMLSNREVLEPVKATAKPVANKEVDPDPPYKDGTRW